MLRLPTVLPPHPPETLAEYGHNTLVKFHTVPNPPEKLAEYLNGGDCTAEGWEMHSILREFVDEWLDSGKREGVDHPWERKVRQKQLQHYLSNNRPMARVGVDGRITVEFHPDQNILLRSEDGDAHPVNLAYFIFLNFLDDPTRERLSRCDSCSAYFARRRMPAKGVAIKGGSFCSECKHKAKRVTVLNFRKRQYERLIGLAAQFWNQYGERKRRSSQVEWVTEQMRRQCAKDTASGAPVWKNTRWVGQHQQEIEAAARGNAEGKA